MLGLGVGGILAYWNDILLHINDVISHVNLIKLVFQAHRDAGINKILKKHFFLEQKWSILETKKTQEGVKLLGSYVYTIVQSCPRERKKAFLGFAGYYREFYQVLLRLQQI